MTKKEESKPSIHSADDLIVKMEAEKLGKAIPDAPKEEQPKAQSEETPPTETKDAPAQEENSDESEEPEAQKEGIEEEPKQNKSEEPSEETSDDELDEYGTKVGKPKLYTEEEVQSMIRKRLKDTHADKEVQEATKDFTPDPNSEDSWEAQLEHVIEKTIQKRESKRVNEEWQREEQATQAEYEIKFTQGMTKYKDFKQVVGSRPITNAMMLATRSMKDPAAFIYAASKQHPKELERIAQLREPVAQATEIGRLEERMKKARIIPQSPPPSKKLKGDASSEMPQLSIDARIASHAKDKIMNRR